MSVRTCDVCGGQLPHHDTTRHVLDPQLQAAEQLHAVAAEAHRAWMAGGASRRTSLAMHRLHVALLEYAKTRRPT